MDDSGEKLASGQWYAVYTKPRQEKVAQENLNRQGYHTYLPLVHLRRRRKGKVCDLVEPLFPRYLFINLREGEDNWGPIRSTLGAVSLVQFGHQAAVVPEALITYLKGEEGDDGVHQFPEPDPRKGDKVRVIDGPLGGYEAVFIEKSTKKRVLLLLKLLGKESRVNVKLSDIELSP